MIPSSFLKLDKKRGVGFRMRSGNDWLLNAIPSRLESGAEGLFGGGSGAAGLFLINGQPCSEAKKMAMHADDEVLMRTPGGGGSGQLK